MNKQESNKLTMMRALLSFMNKNQPVWQSISPIATAYYQVYNLVELIEVTQHAIDVAKSGESDQKEKLHENMIEAGFEIASFIRAFADATENTVLKGKVDFPVSELRNLRDAELPNKLKVVLEQVVGREAQLEPYGVTPEKVANLSNLVGQYIQQLPVTRNNLSAQKSGNAQIAASLKKANDLIVNQLDRLMLRFEKEDPKFYMAYKANRKVVDYGNRYETPTQPDEKPAKTEE